LNYYIELFILIYIYITWLDNFFRRCVN